MESIKWQPKKDITAYELALALQPLRGAFVDNIALDSLPDCAKRHWEQVQRKEPAKKSQGLVERLLGKIFCHTS